MREKTGHIPGQRGLMLFYRVWEPEESRGSFVLVHGMNEHSGRYHHVAEHLGAHGFTVYALDHRGHGQSEGVRCHVDRFDDYLADLHLLVDMAANQGKPIMLGHSLGGLIAFRYAVAHQDRLQALVLSSPFFRSQVKVSPVQAALLPLIVRLAPRLAMPANLGSENVCRDPEIVKAYTTDPMVGTTATPRWYLECTRAGRESPELAASLQIPSLVLQAGADRLVDPAATEEVYAKIGSERKAYRRYQGMYHEILNDPEKATVLADLSDWLQQEGLLP
ncbi:MAG: lysophospholipase [Mycobacterium leprae]